MILNCLVLLHWFCTLFDILYRTLLGMIFADLLFFYQVLFLQGMCWRHSPKETFGNCYHFLDCTRNIPVWLVCTNRGKYVILLVQTSSIFGYGARVTSTIITVAYLTPYSHWIMRPWIVFTSLVNYLSTK